jgi:hypothetical protein
MYSMSLRILSCNSCPKVSIKYHKYLKSWYGRPILVALYRFSRCRFGWGEVSFVELQLYSMCHVQEHAAQLNLFLGQRTGAAPGWVAMARKSAA